MIRAFIKPDEWYHWLGGPGFLLRLDEDWLVVPLSDYAVDKDEAVLPLEQIKDKSRILRMEDTIDTKEGEDRTKSKSP